MQNIPSKTLFSDLPQQTGEKGGFKGYHEVNYFIRDDLIDHKEHPKSEKEGEEIFQEKSDDQSHAHEKTEIESMEVGGHRGNTHTRQMKEPF